jgi:transmembrane sensor
MSKKISNYHLNERKELIKLFKELSGKELDFEKLSEDTNSLETEEITVTNSETELILDSVKNKLGLAKHETPASTLSKDNLRTIARRKFRFYLAAAIIIVAVGISYLLIPVINVVPFGETATIELPDGSSVIMNSGSKIKYDRLFGIMNRNIKFSGEAYFEVKPSDNMFIVKTNGAIVEVTGTEFNVRSWRNDPDSAVVVTVASGTVYFYPVSNNLKRVELTEGLTSSWHHGEQKPTNPDIVDLKDIIAWKENKLSFIGQPLRIIFNEIERKFDVNIEINNEQIGNEILTTFYSSPKNVEMLLDDITTVKGLNYRETANGYVVFNETNNR